MRAPRGLEEGLTVEHLRPLPVERVADAEALRHALYIVRALAAGLRWRYAPARDSREPVRYHQLASTARALKGIAKPDLTAAPCHSRYGKEGPAECFRPDLNLSDLLR